MDSLMRECTFEELVRQINHRSPLATDQYQLSTRHSSPLQTLISSTTFNFVIYLLQTKASVKLTQLATSGTASGVVVGARRRRRGGGGGGGGGGGYQGTYSSLDEVMESALVLIHNLLLFGSLYAAQLRQHLSVDTRFVQVRVRLGRGTVVLWYCGTSMHKAG